MSSPDERAGPPRGRPAGAPTSPGLRRLLEPSELAPVQLDLRRVFWAGIALWTLALLVSAVLTVTGHAQPRLLWICLTGAGLGLVGVLWDRRRRARTDARLP